MRRPGLLTRSKPESTSEGPYMNVKRSLVHMQVEAGYAQLMRWFSDLAETGVQIGFTSVSLTSIGGSKINVPSRSINNTFLGML